MKTKHYCKMGELVVYKHTDANGIVRWSVKAGQIVVYCCVEYRSLPMAIQEYIAREYHSHASI